jgi:hypothetical protein
MTPTSQEPFNTDIVSVLGLTAVFYPYVLVLGGLVGLPLFLILRRIGMVRWWSATLGGALAGAAAAYLVRGYFYPKDFAVLVPEGAAAGFVFWLVWRFSGAQQRAPGDVPRPAGSGRA